jgi:hypothetical protein
MAKQEKDQIQSSRKERANKQDQLASLKKLRQMGVLTRQQFRLQTFDKGLQGSTKGSPLLTVFETVKTKDDRKVVVPKTRQWVHIDK